MSDFTLSGREYFDALPQPVLLYGSAIEYCNSAACALFAGQRLKPGAPLPAGLPEPGLAPCAATLTLDNGTWAVELRVLEDGVLYLLTPLPEEDDEALAQMHSLSTQLRLGLSRTVLSVDLLQSQLSELERKRSAESVARLNRNLYQLLRMSDHLSLCTRTQRELQLLFPPDPVNLNSFCQELYYTLEPMLLSMSRTLRCDLTDEALNVDVHRELLLRLIYNLISNATAAGGDLTLTLRRRGDRAVLTLTDTGAGVPPDRMSRLFLPTGTERNLALGLTLCRRIAALYDGQFMLSPQKKGTTVSLSLPLRKPRDEDEIPHHGIDVVSGYDLLLSELSPYFPDDFYHVGEEE